MSSESPADAVKVRLRRLEGLRQRVRWLRIEAQRERLWIDALRLNDAPDWLLQEHAERLARFGRMLHECDSRMNACII